MPFLLMRCSFCLMLTLLFPSPAITFPRSSLSYYFSSGQHSIVLRQDFLDYLLLLGSSVQGRRVIPAILRPCNRKKTETISTSEDSSDACLSSAGLSPCHSSDGRGLAEPVLTCLLLCPSLGAKTAPALARASQYPNHQTLWALCPLHRFGILINCSQV